MTLARKVELGGGIATVLLAIVVTLHLIRETQETALRLKDESRSLQAFLMGFFLYILPASLIALGAYAHAVKQKSWGFAAVMVGSVITVILLLLLFLALGPYAGNLGFLLNGLLTIVALITMSASVAVQAMK
jgi:uncharacterized BrkB/YihY/UPF0761 family membrane protein